MRSFSSIRYKLESSIITCPPNKVVYFALIVLDQFNGRIISNTMILLFYVPILQLNVKYPPPAQLFHGVVTVTMYCVLKTTHAIPNQHQCSNYTCSNGVHSAERPKDDNLAIEHSTISCCANYVLR